PSLELLWRSKIDKKIKNIYLNTSPVIQSWTIEGDSRSIFRSEKFLSLIDYACNKKYRIVFCTEHPYYQALFCFACRSIVRCQVCKNGKMYSKKNGLPYICFFCKVEVASVTCCVGEKILYVGAGSQKILEY